MPIIREEWLVELIKPYIKIRNSVLSQYELEKINLDEFPEFEKIIDSVTDEVIAKALVLGVDDIKELHEKENEHIHWNLWARTHDGVLDWFIFPLTNEKISDYLDEINDEIGYYLTRDTRIDKDDLLSAIRPLIEDRNTLLSKHQKETLDFDEFPEMGIAVIRVTDMMVGFALKWEEEDVLVFHFNDLHPAKDLWNRMHDLVVDWFTVNLSDEDISRYVDEINQETGWYIKSII